MTTCTIFCFFQLHFKDITGDVYFVVVPRKDRKPNNASVHVSVPPDFPTLSLLSSPSPLTPTEDGICQNGSQNVHFSFTFFLYMIFCLDALVGQ